MSPRKGGGVPPGADRSPSDDDGQIGQQDTAPAEALGTMGNTAHRLSILLVRHYNRIQIQGDPAFLEQPSLLVANHGFGGIFDLNVFAVNAALDEFKIDRPVTSLTHQLAWTMRLGPVVEALGAQPASAESAQRALARGHHVLVFPGGDLDAAKSWRDRNEVKFGGRSGFARLAMEQDVPVVPVVTAGAGESLFVFSDGQRLARMLRADKLLRMKAWPISLSLPWGFSAGLAGLFPYLPLPTKLSTTVLAPMTATKGESAADFAVRVQSVMQETLTSMTRGRRPVLG